MTQLFDFQCTDCEYVFEEWDTSERSARPHCPNCEGTNVDRLISAPNFDLDGMVASGSSSSDGMTTSIDAWQRRRKQQMAIEKRNMDRHGTTD